MADSSSFTSLQSLVNSHLSNLNLEESSIDKNETNSKFPMPVFSGLSNGPSDTRLISSNHRLSLTSLSQSGSPISAVLSEQISNMLKKKELERQQELEKERVQEEIRKLKLEEDNYVIDLMKAVQLPGEERPEPCEEVISSSSSLESLFDNLNDPITESEAQEQKEPLLPCKTDMSYIFKQNIKLAECSAFGKVLTARVRPVPMPYLRENIQTDIVRFDFSTKSPCDIIKENLKKRPVRTTRNFVLDFIKEKPL